MIVDFLGSVRDISPHVLTAPIKSDTFQTVVVVVNNVKPFTHASIPTGEPLLGAAVSGFFVG